MDIEIEKDNVKLPLDKLSYMLLCYVVMLIITFLKGSEHVKSVIGIEP